jgi:hypothetical protein
MNTEKLKGIAVVSQDEGAKLGQVDQALFDPLNLDLRVLRVKGEGQTFLAPFEQVACAGRFARPGSDPGTLPTRLIDDQAGWRERPAQPVPPSPFW